jgi:hypothetical protein
MVTAPCCGRRTAADTILDLRAVPGTVVRAGGHGSPVDHDWLCDGCWNRLVADPRNTWTRSRLMSACGAPPDMVREHYARERAEEMARADCRAGRDHRPEDALEMARAALPVGVDPHRKGRA